MARISSSSKDSWGSVRKLRHKLQLENLIRYAVQKEGQTFSFEDITQIIREHRAKMEFIRLSITQIGGRKALRLLGDLSSTAYKSLAKDITAFAKSIGIFNIGDGRVICPSRTKELNKYLNEEPNRWRSKILALVLGSKYKAYLHFIFHLQEIGGHFYVPSELKKRTKASGFPKYLRDNGFLTDAASFYTIRDFLYDFGLLNWRIMPESAREHIFLTCKLVAKRGAPSARYAHRVNLKNYIILYDRYITNEKFENTIAKHYLTLSDNKWGTIVNIFELRNMVTEELCMSDHQFNKAIIGMSRRTRAKIIAELSQGIVSTGKSSGILTKALNVPMIGDKIYGTYLRLLRRE